MVIKSEPLDGEISKKVRLLRLQRKMSQADLGRVLDVTFQQIQKYEEGSNRISSGSLSRLAQLFKVPITAFYGEGITRTGKKGKQSRLTIDREAAQLLKAFARNSYRDTNFSTGSEATQLLKAFARISHRETKRKLVQLAEALADQRRTDR